MCFVIAGIQPKTKTLDSAARRCPQCGLHQAEIRQVDHYISLFFLPLFRVKHGEPFLYCRRCERPVGGALPLNGGSPSGMPPLMCDQCGRRLEKEFIFCPYCGKKG